MIKSIIFDFDGVLVDSVDIKTEAFVELYKEFDRDVTNKVIKHHLVNGGISRYEKIKYYHNEFLGIDVSGGEIKKLAAEFSSIVKEKVVKAPYIKGALEFLRDYSDKYLMFICSGTPEIEIKDIVRGRGMNNFFRGVYGSPETKPNIITKILAGNNFNKNEVVFLGDSINDYDAAISADVPFIGVTESAKTFPGSVNIISDLTKLSHNPFLAE